MSVPVQHGLFTSSRPLEIDRNFCHTVRTALDATSWIELVSDWLSGPDRLFDELAWRVPWRQHHRLLFGQRFLEPRLTAEYRNLRDVPSGALGDAAAALSSHYGVKYDSVWLNFYRSGSDSTGWHRDHFSCRRDECIVPVLTLGAARRLLIKPRHGGTSLSFTPRSGDLLVMGGRSQQDWLHGVPKEAGASSARISVNFQSSAQARR